MVVTPAKQHVPPGPPGSAGSMQSGWGDAGDTRDREWTPLRGVQASMQPLVDALAQDKNTLEQLHLEGQLENAQLRKQVQELADAFHSALQGDHCYRCENLQKEVEASRAEYVRVREEYENVVTETRALRLRSELLTQDKADLEMQLHTGVADLTSERAMMVAELEMFKRQVMQLESERHHEVAKRQDAEDRLHQQVKSDTEIDGFKSIIKELQAELKTLKTTRATPAPAPAPSGDYHKLQADLKTATTHRDALGSELTSMKHQLTTLGGQIKEIESSRMALYKDATAAKEEAKTALAAKADAVKELCVARERLINREQQEAALLSELRSTRERLDEAQKVKEEAAVLRDRMQTFKVTTAKVEKLESELSEREQLISTLRLRMESTASDAGSERSRLEGETASLRALLTQRETQLHTELQAERDTTQHLIHQKEQDLHLLVDQERARAVAAAKTWTTDKEALLQQFAEKEVGLKEGTSLLQHQLTTLRSQSDETETRFQELEKQLRKEISQLERERDEAKEQLEEGQNMLSMSRKQSLHAVQEERTKTEQLEKQLRDEAAALASRIETERDEACKQLEESRGELNVTREQSLLTMREERAKIKELEEQLRKETSRLEAANDEAHRQLGETQRELDVNRQSFLAAQEDQVRATNLEKQLRESASKLESVNDELEEARNELSAGERRSALAVQEEQVKAEQLERQLREEAAALASQLGGERDEAHRQLEELQEELGMTRKNSQALVHEERERTQDLERRLKEEASKVAQQLETVEEMLRERDEVLAAERVNAEQAILGGRRESQLAVVEEREKSQKLEMQLHSEAARISQLEAEVSGLQHRLNEALQQTEEARRSEHDKVQELNRVAAQVAQLETARDEVHSQLEETQGELSISKNQSLLTVQEERTKAEELERQLRKEAAALATQLEGERSGLNSQLEEARRELGMSRTHAQTLVHEERERTQDLERRLKEEASKVAQQLETVEGMLRERDEVLATERAKAQQTILDTKQESQVVVKEEQEKVLELEKQIRDLQHKLEDMGRQLRGVERERGGERDMLHEKITVLETENEMLGAKMKGMGMEADGVRGEIREVKEEVVGLREKLREARVSLAATEGKSEALQSSLKAKEAELCETRTDLQTTITNGIKERATYEGRVVALGDQLAACGPVVVESLKDDIVVLVNDRDKLEQRALRLEWEKAEIRKALDESETRLTAASTQTGKVEAELRKKVIELEPKAAEAAVATRELESMRSSKKTLQQDFEKLRDEANKFTSEIGRLRDGQARAEAERDRVAREKEAVKEQLAAAEGVARRLQGELGDAADHIGSLEGEVRTRSERQSKIEVELQQEAAELHHRAAEAERAKRVGEEREGYISAELEGVVAEAQMIDSEKKMWKARAMEAEEYRRTALAEGIGPAEMRSLASHLHAATPSPSRDRMLSHFTHPSTLIPPSTAAFVTECLRATVSPPRPSPAPSSTYSRAASPLKLVRT